MTAKALEPNACLNGRNNPVCCNHLLGPEFYFLPMANTQYRRKLGLKTKKLKTEIVKGRTQKIWANRTITQLDELFKENLGWWGSIAVIFFQSSLKHIKK